MNILFLTQVLPFPLDAGPKIRSYYVLQFLAQTNMVTLLSFTRPSDSSEAISHVKSICTRVEIVPMRRSRFLDVKALVKSVLTGQPFLITRDEATQMDQMVRDLVKEDKFDLIHADQLWMAPYALKAQKEAQKCGYFPRIILDQHNAVQLIPGRMAESSSNFFIKAWLKREARLMTIFEPRICDRFDHVIWVTEDDLKVVYPKVESSSGVTGKNTVIPICIDTDEIDLSRKAPKTKNILFVGGMHWPPNAEGAIWFAKDVFPLIRKEHPDAHFIAVGKQPPGLLKGENIVAPGYVESTDLYWKEAKVFVVPLKAGGGMRVKILDAWAKGVPIISTSIGAEGIKYCHKKDILIADTAEEFAQAVQWVLLDGDFALQLSVAGIETLRKYYDWKMIYPLWEKVYQSIST